MRALEIIGGGICVTAVAVLVMGYVFSACALIDRCYEGERYADEFFVSR